MPAGFNLTLRQVARFLRLHHPAAYPVELRRAALPGAFGDSSLRTDAGGRRYFRIRLARDLDEDTATLILMHEWAHVKVWRSSKQESIREYDHDAEWGVAHAHIWRDLHDDAG